MAKKTESRRLAVLSEDPLVVRIDTQGDEPTEGIAKAFVECVAELRRRFPGRRFQYTPLAVTNVLSAERQAHELPDYRKISIVFEWVIIWLAVAEESE